MCRALLARNQAAAGLSDAAALGNRCSRILSPALAASRQAATAEVIRTRSPFRFEDTQDGKFYEHHLYPVSDPSGRITRLALSSRDVTDRRQLEETLRSTVEFLRQILESSTTVAIISVNQLGRILDREHRGGTHSRLHIGRNGRSPYFCCSFLPGPPRNMRRCFPSLRESLPGTDRVHGSSR